MRRFTDDELTFIKTFAAGERDDVRTQIRTLEAAIKDLERQKERLQQRITGLDLFTENVRLLHVSSEEPGR